MRYRYQVDTFEACSGTFRNDGCKLAFRSDRKKRHCGIHFYDYPRLYFGSRERIFN